MDYMSEVDAFYEWLEINPISDSARNLWHALMHTANRAGWVPEFTVAISVIEAKTGMSRSAIYRARNTLKETGRIEFRNRDGNLSSVYRLIPFVFQIDTQTETRAEHKPKRKPNTMREHYSSPYPSDTPNLNNNNNRAHVEAPSDETHSAALAEIVRAFEREIHLPSKWECDLMVDWSETFEAGMVLAVIRYAVLRNARNAKFIDSVLADKMRRGITTLAGYEAAERDFQDRKRDARVPDVHEKTENPYGSREVIL